MLHAAYCLRKCLRTTWPQKTSEAETTRRALLVTPSVVRLFYFRSHPIIHSVQKPSPQPPPQPPVLPRAAPAYRTPCPMSPTTSSHPSPPTSSAMMPRTALRFAARLPNRTLSATRPSGAALWRPSSLERRKERAASDTRRQLPCQALPQHRSQQQLCDAANRVWNPERAGAVEAGQATFAGIWPSIRPWLSTPRGSARRPRICSLHRRPARLPAGSKCPVQSPPKVRYSEAILILESRFGGLK